MTKVDEVEEEDASADEMTEVDVLADAASGSCGRFGRCIDCDVIDGVSLILIKASVMRNGSIMDAMVGIVYSLIKHGHMAGHGRRGNAHNMNALLSGANEGQNNEGENNVGKQQHISN